MTVLENIILAPMEVQKRKKEEVTAEARKLLKRIGLEDKENARPGELSGGQKQRIAMISCMHFVKHGEFKDALAIADLLQHHPHDLIHKAVGWILREIGKEDEQLLVDYLTPRYKEMPRTMLRYAIERFEEGKRKAFLNSEI